MAHLAKLLALLMLVGCGNRSEPEDQGRSGRDSAGQKPTVPIETPGNTGRGFTKHTVMVIDTGFDLSIPEIANNLKGAYTIQCDDEDDKPSAEDSQRLATITKTELMNEYTERDTNVCRVVEGIDDYVNPELQNLAYLRNDWNRYVATGDVGAATNIAPFERLNELISGQYHGTHSAGLVGYKNPGYQNTGVDLILVKIELGSAAETEASYMSGPCPTQAAFDNLTRLYSDPDVIQAYASRRPSQETEQLVKIARDNDVTLLNMSFGPGARTKREMLYMKAGCSRLDLRAFYQAKGKMSDATNLYRKQNNILLTPNVLAVVAAGNDSARIDSPTDQDDCPTPSDTQTIMIGSHDSDRQTLSEFSNRGNCVTAYTLGSAVVAPGPLGYKKLIDGTSFSAPIAVRYFTQVIPPGMPGEQMRAFIQNLARRSSKGFLPQEAYPAELDGARMPQPSYWTQPDYSYPSGYSEFGLTMHGW